MAARTQFAHIMAAASHLVDSGVLHGQGDLKSRLQSRLNKYRMQMEYDRSTEGVDSLDEIKLATAKECLSVIEMLQVILIEEENQRLLVSSSGTQDSGAIPTIGARDTAQIRTLLSIFFCWGIDPLLTRFLALWTSHEVANTTHPHFNVLMQIYQSLSPLVQRLSLLVFPECPNSLMSQTLVTSVISTRHLSDILKSCITLGWLPNTPSPDTLVPLPVARSLISRLLSRLPSSQTITALGSVLSSDPIPIHTRKACSTLLSQQLLRPDGVSGLFEAIFGNIDSGSDDFDLEKFEHIARVLTSVPTGMTKQEYFHAIVPHLVAVVNDSRHLLHRRAAGFSISRLLRSSVGSKILLDLLHSPLLHPSTDIHDTSIASVFTPDKALSTLISLTLNSDPSPTFITVLISPIMPTMYSLLHHLDQVKTSDPALRESVMALLITWGRVVSLEVGLSGLWSVIHGDRFSWKVDIDGTITQLQRSEQQSFVSLMLCEVCQMPEPNEDENANYLGLYPDPIHFVNFVNTINRSDVTSELFIKLLKFYCEVKVKPDHDPLQTLVCLQLIMKMQTQCFSASGSDMFKKPRHILAFAKHALETATASTPVSQRQKSHLQLTPDVHLADADSDDEDDKGLHGPDAQIVETIMTLVLSMLEANDALSARSEPVLNDIYELLEPFVSGPHQSIRTLAQECRMVMTARLAATSVKPHARSENEEQEHVHEIYQKALKLLQDPILPVRAHGLLLLRQLVGPSRSHMDAALLPAILSIFLQSIQDDDSYIFLSAIQGLSTMVDKWGNNVLSGLVREYVHDLDDPAIASLTQRIVDTRLRIGEALGQIIRRCGQALGIYADILVPPLFQMLSASHLPTVLRVSSLSLLADCENTCPLALLPYIMDLTNAMVDLLQIEIVTAKDQAADDMSQLPAVSMDDQPTSNNSKFPPLRRAALRFLSLLAQATTKQLYDSVQQVPPLPPSVVKRAKVTLAYVSSIDEDVLVRVMAREAVEALEQMERAVLDTI